MFLRLVVVLALFYLVFCEENSTLTNKSGDFWEETEPFSQNKAAVDLRLSPDVVPSFYRLKIKADLDNSTFSGHVYITIRASRKVKEIILHSQNLSISNDAKLTEQIYERVETIHLRRRRDVEVNNKTIEGNLTVANGTEQNVTANLNTSIPIDVTKNTVVPDLNIILNSSNYVDDVSSTSTTPKTPIPLETPTQVTHSSTTDVKIISITNATGNRLILTLATSLKPGVDYILELPFSGAISDSLTGFYKSTYTNANKEEKSLAVTQFEPTSARAAFPCFDEPGFKAKFEISISHRKNLTVLSNMKAVTKEDVENEPGWVWTHFERSVNMSTYLVAYVISDFKSLETTYVSKDNVTKVIRVWARPELLSKAQYAITITPKLIKYYEDVFGQPYVLDKLDLIAIPDFSSGAMENWGLITFRETGLLYDEENSAPRDKQTVAIDIAHELAHQWFGNLVTMQWWTDLWLNEGFATYIEYVGVDHIEPEWAMLDSFTRDKFDLLRLDALKNTSPVSRKVIDASEIAQKFDEISYLKGANLIRMLNNTISEELFHKGLVDYLNYWKFSNAEENDLWASMSAVASVDPALKGRSLVTFMNSWTRQPGYPVINVQRDYSTGKVHLEQRLFTSSKKPYEWMRDQIWQVPISYAAVDTPEHSWSTKPQLWLTERFTTADLTINSSQPLYVNIGATGYYRVNYDQQNWERLSKALKSGQIQSPNTKAQLLDDAFNLAKANLLNYSYALDLTTSFKDGEDSKTLWDLLLINMGFLRHNLKPTSAYIYFQDYMKIILHEQLKKVQYGLVKPKDDNEAFLVESLVMWECMMEAPRCLNWAKTEFNKWMENPKNNTIPPYLRSLVYNVAIKYGGRTEFDFLWNMFKTSTDPYIKTLIIGCLPSTQEESLISLLLEKSLSEIPKQYAVSVWAVEAPVGTRIAQQFLKNNFDRIYTTFTDMDAFKFSSVLNGAFGIINHQDELDLLKSLALSHKSQLMAISQTIQKLVDTASLRLNWMKAHSAAVSRWLQRYVTDYSAETAPKSSEVTEAKHPENMTTKASIESSHADQQNTTTESQPDMNVTKVSNDSI